MLYSGIILVCFPEVASYKTQGNKIPNLTSQSLFRKMK